MGFKPNIISRLIFQTTNFTWDYTSNTVDYLILNLTQRFKNTL